MAKLHIFRLKLLSEGQCAVCSEYGLHMHVDTDISVIVPEGIVCEECAKELQSAELQLLAWLNATEEELNSRVFIQHCHQSRTQRHWNSPDRP